MPPCALHPPQRRGWQDAARVAVIPTAWRARPSPRDTAIRTLEQAVRWLRAPVYAGYPNGIACYEIWAQDIRSAKPDRLVPERNVLHPLIWDLATRKHFGQVFLQEAAKLLPEAEEQLLQAAALGRDFHDAMYGINRLAGARWPGQPQPKLADPGVQEAIADVVLKAVDLDRRMADLIEAGLGKCGTVDP